MIIKKEHCWDTEYFKSLKKVNWIRNLRHFCFLNSLCFSSFYLPKIHHSPFQERVPLQYNLYHIMKIKFIIPSKRQKEISSLFFPFLLFYIKVCKFFCVLCRFVFVSHKITFFPSLPFLLNKSISLANSASVILIFYQKMFYL